MLKVFVFVAFEVLRKSISGPDLFRIKVIIIVIFMEDHCSITQVAREEDTSKSLCLLSLSEKTDTTKKSKNSKFLQQFLCCFRPSPSSVAQQDVSLPHSPTTTTTLSAATTTVTTTTTTATVATCVTEDSNTTVVTTAIESETFLPEPTVIVTDKRKNCAVIDLDETLVHSSFAPVSNADFIIPVEIDGTIHQVYVLKRPHVDEFLQKMGELFECILFTASLGKYADPVADLLDKWGVFQVRLFRESCVFHRGSYVKDLSKLGRSLNRMIIIDNSPASYMFHPQNAVPVMSWFDDVSDCELLNLMPLFESLAASDDVYTLLNTLNNNPLDSQLYDNNTDLQDTGGGVITMATRDSNGVVSLIHNADSMEDSDLDEEAFERGTMS